MTTSSSWKAFGLRSIVPILALVLLVVGCSSQGTIKGKVSYKGTPLKGGTVTFIPSKGGPVSSTIGEDGSFSAARVPVGDARITVETNSLLPPAPVGRTGGPPKGVAVKPPPNVPAGMDLSKTSFGAGMGATPPNYVKIPDEYSDPDKSGLTHKVTGGSQNKDIDLK